MQPTVTSGGHLEEWNDPRTFRGFMQNSTTQSTLERSPSTTSSKYSFDGEDEKVGSGVAGVTRGNTMRGGVVRGNTVRHFPATEKNPFERGDGLREDGRGYRGF
jgi:hypothetical protein